MKPKDFSRGNSSWEHFCNRLGTGSLSHWSLLRTIFWPEGRTQVFIRPCLLARLDSFAACKVNIEILRGVSWEVGWGWVCKIESLVACEVSWDVGTGWVGSHARCNMASWSGKVQKRDAWDENLGVSGFVVCLWTLVQDGLAHIRGVTWRAVPAKFKTDVWDENLRVWGFVVYLWEVGSGLAHMRGVIWRAVPAKFKTGMCEMNIFGSEVCSVSWDVGSGWLAHMSGVIWRAVLAKFKTDVWGENLRVWGRFRMGWHKYVV